MTVLRAVALALASALTGCYASHQAASPEAWAEALARAQCEVQHACPNDSGVVRGGSGPVTRGDIELCMSHGTGRIVRDAMAPWVEAVARGDASLDPVFAAQCLEDVGRATCGVRIWPRSFAAEGFPIARPFGTGQPGRLAFSAACDATYVRAGGRAPAETCTGPLDCAPGAYCTELEGRLACRAYDAVGAACGDGSSGVSGACFGPDLVCSDGRCTTIARRRSATTRRACGVLVEASGVVDERCVPGTTCARPGGEDPVCVATRGEGEPCSLRSPCAGPLICAERTGAGGTCRAITRATAPGAACARHPDGAITTVCDPRAALTCTSDDDTAGTCVPE